MINLYQKTWTEINNDIAQKIVRLRKRKKITQKQLAARSGVSLGSLKRFEQSGEISLQSLTKIAIALDVENELEDLFNNVPFASIEEVINEQKIKKDRELNDYYQLHKEKMTKPRKQ